MKSLRSVVLVDSPYLYLYFCNTRGVTHKNDFIVKGSPRYEERQPLDVKVRKDMFLPHTENWKHAHKYTEHSDDTSNKMH